MLLRIATRGASAHLRTVPPSGTVPNHRSAYTHAELVSSYIRREVAEGKLLRVTDFLRQHPRLRFRNAKIAAIDKPDGSIRLLLDLSDYDPRTRLPRGVNFCCDHPGWTPMASPEDAARALCILRQSAPSTPILLQVTDLKDAYRSVPLAPADWPITRIHWQGEDLWDLRLSQGAKWSAAAQCSIATLLAEAASDPSCKTPTVFSYVDDFLSIDLDPTAPTTRRLHSILTEIGYTISVKKLEAAGPPAARKTWIGFVWDTERWEVGLHPTKATEALQLLETLISSARSADTQLVRRLAGKLVHFTRVLVPGKPFTVNLLRDGQQAWMRGQRRCRLSPPALADLLWWRDTLRQPSRWTTAIWSPILPHSCVMTTDASVTGFGVHFEPSGLHGTWPTVQTSDRITALELLTVLIGLSELRPLVSGRTVLVRTDNQAVAYILATGRTRGRRTLPILRALATLCVDLRTHLKVEWIAGLDNPIADALSRGHLDLPEVRRLHLRPLRLPDWILSLGVGF